MPDSVNDKGKGKAYDGRLARRLLGYLTPYKYTALFTLIFLMAARFMANLTPYLIKKIIDGPVTAGNTEGILMLCGILMGVRFLEFLFVVLNGYLSNYTGQKIIFDLRRDLFRKTEGQSLAFFGKNPVGSLMARITSDVDVLNQLFSSGVVNILGEIFMLIFIVGFMLFLDVKLTLITFITLPFIAWGTILFKTRVRDSFRSIRLLSAKINTIMQETVSGIDVVQLFRGQNFNRKKFAKENGAYRDEYIRTVLYYGLYFPFVKIMNFTAMALIIYYGGIRFLAPGHGITVGELVAFITYAELFFQPIRELCDKYNILQSSMAASERIFGLLDTDEYIPEPESAVALNRPASTVSFSNVTFGYVPGVPVINNFSLSIRKGEKVAVVGTSGAGKTTLINLLNRFYEPWSGSIKLGGIDISRLSKKDIRRAVGTVSQDIVLFSGTVGDNISLFDETVSPEKKAKVASSVNAAGFAGIRGEGTDTILGEGGSSISVGQRQLLSFARLLVYDPDIVVLDEATSSVDTESELKIQKAISKILKGRTSIIVAHRLSTVRNADRIIVLHKGAIAEEGSHDELLRRGGIYHRLYTTQFKAEKK